MIFGVFVVWELGIVGFFGFILFMVCLLLVFCVYVYYGIGMFGDKCIIFFKGVKMMCMSFGIDFRGMIKYVMN